MNLEEYMINESTEFSKMENNPMIYVLIIPKLLKTVNLDEVKKDPTLKPVIDVTEKFIKTLRKDTIKNLENAFKPYAIMEVFKLSPNYKAVLDKYLAEFREIICNNESNFIKSIELDKNITALYNTQEYLVYRNTL